jgi:hypothetical protein
LGQGGTPRDAQGCETQRQHGQRRVVGVHRLGDEVASMGHIPLRFRIPVSFWPFLRLIGEDETR